VAKHFIEQGRINLAYIGPENDEKYIGFQSELYEKGFGVDENMCIFIPNTPLSNFEIKNYIKKFLGTLSKYPDGFFTTNDTVAYELVKELVEKGFEILLNQISEERFYHFGNFEILPSLVIRRSTIK
ncbi:MAG: hypothetical protein ACRCXX_10315, partial [Cetobacterium sp.]|uniref:hypothetical protein n=1 Tax=Cetobacterium sp. TaxID=2071632 RepID=UPI003F3198DF